MELKCVRGFAKGAHEKKSLLGGHLEPDRGSPAPQGSWVTCASRDKAYASECSPPTSGSSTVGCPHHSGCSIGLSSLGTGAPDKPYALALPLGSAAKDKLRAGESVSAEERQPVSDVWLSSCAIGDWALLTMKPSKRPRET